MAAWTSERIWDAVDAWRWIPPAATRVKTDWCELAVTRGSFALTYVYGFHVEDPGRTEDLLRETRRRVEELGGTGARLQWTPRSTPPDLLERLARFGFRPVEEAEVLVWELQDETGGVRLPEFALPQDVAVREALVDAEFDSFVALGARIFGDPPPTPESRRAFVEEFHRRVREGGHSDRYLAWAGAAPVGRAGMELAGPVARFWGTGVLPEHRRRGVYGALVRARCAAAAARGSEIALVTARMGTSGPILLRHGFRPMGTIRVFEVRW